MFLLTNICLNICMSLHDECAYVDICSNPTSDHQKCHPDCQPGASFSKLWPLIQSLASQGCHWYQKPRRETLNNLKYTPQNMFLGPPGRARMVFSHNFWHRLIQPTKPCADSSPYLHEWIGLSSISPIQVVRNLRLPMTTPRPGQYLLIALITCTQLFNSKFWLLIQTRESLGCHCYLIARRETLNKLKYSPKTMYLVPQAPGRACMPFRS